MSETRKPKTYSITPTWAQIAVPMILRPYSSMNRKGQKIAEEELLRMAQAADAWNDHCKSLNTEDDDTQD